VVAKGQKENFWYVRRYWIALVLAIGLYLPTVTFDYTLDDAIVIYDNDFTKKGISGIWDLLRYDTFRGFFKVEGKENLVAGGRYRPLTPMMFALEYQIVGKNPWLSHLVNVLCYGLLVFVLLFFLERYIFLEKKQWFLALIATLIFAAHPIHTEVVANIKGRDEIVCALFGLLSLHYLFKKQHLFAGGLFILSILSKEMALTWIVVAFGYFWIYQGKGVLDSVKKTFPLFVAFGLYMILRIGILGWPQQGGVIMEMMNNPFIKLVGNEYLEFNFVEKTAAIFYALGKYILLLIYPHPLTHDYYPRTIGVMGIGNIWVIFSILAHFILIAGVFYWRKSNKEISFYLFFYLAGLILISNLFFPIGTHMGERFIFMSSIPFCCLVATGLSKVGKRKTGGIGAAILFTLFAIKTTVRIPVWKNDFTLFTTDVKTSPNSAKALNAAAGSLVDYCISKQLESCSSEQLQKAIDYSKGAIQIHPNYKSAHLILGNAYILNQDYDLAIVSLKNALAIDSGLESAKKNLMIAYVEAAKIYGEKQGNPEKAIKLLEEANKYDQNHIEVIRLLGIAHGVKGEYSQAMSYFERLLEKNPKDVEALRNIGITYMQMGDKEQGEIYLQKAEQLNSDER